MTTRLMHTMLHVADMDRTLAFYCDVLGMTVQVQRDNPEARHRNAFVGYGPYDTTTQVEFVSYGGREAYDKGDAYGHIALGVDDVAAFCERVRDAGGVVSREPKLLGSGSRIAFIQDPDGYEIEVIQPAALAPTPPTF